MTVQPDAEFFRDKVALVVEDNAANFLLLARLLNALGIQCEWKSSGFEVLEFSKTLPRLDIILLDIHLPYEDGYTALKKIRSADHLKQIPVVAVTADVSTDSLTKAQKAGFDGFLGKPIDPDRFPEQLFRILTGNKVWEMY
jgi:two-component system, cell cycle response regulator DivK